MDDKVGERRNPRLTCVQSEAVAEIGEERQSELTAGLRKPQHHIPCHAAIGTHRAAGDLALDHAGAQVVLGRVVCSGISGRSTTFGSSSLTDVKVVVARDYRARRINENFMKKPDTRLTSHHAAGGQSGRRPYGTQDQDTMIPQDPLAQLPVEVVSTSFDLLQIALGVAVLVVVVFIHGAGIRRISRYFSERWVHVTTETPHWRVNLLFGSVIAQFVIVHLIEVMVWALPIYSA